MGTEVGFKSESRANKLSYKLGLILHAFLSLPKTVYFNFRCFPFMTAIKLPVLVSFRTKLLELHKGLITFDSAPYRFMVKFGFGGSSGIIERKSLICLEEGGCIRFSGKADFCAGTSLRNSGYLKFGNKFWSNKNCTIWCSKSISFGDKKITCLYPMNEAHIDDPNKHSLILLLNKGKDDRFLFMGDAGVAEEMAAIENSKKLNIDIAGSILKLGHHGSSTSSSEEFIDFVSPSAAVLSYGKNNSYGHPHKEVVQLINKKNLKTYSTAVKGQITIEK